MYLVNFAKVFDVNTKTDRSGSTALMFTSTAGHHIYF